nr:MAG: hypothetical protein [Bacteriophage sp.]
MGVGIITQPLFFFISNNMGKRCLNKLAGGIAVGCTIPRVGVKDIYLMHAGDVSFEYNSGTGLISAATFVGGAKSYKIEGYKQNIQVNCSLRSLDASSAMDSSVTFKVQHTATSSDFVNTLTTGRFRVLAVLNSGVNVVLGSTIPLECSAADFDSNANANMITLTLSTPEGSAGSPMLAVLDAVKNTIISKSV